MFVIMAFFGDPAIFPGNHPILYRLELESTVEPVLTHIPRWTSGGMGYHRLWAFRDFEKKTLKLQISPKYVFKLP